MSMVKQGMRLGAIVFAAGAVLGLTAGPAGAWPVPLTGDDTKYLNMTRGKFPGDDDQLILAGRQVCNMLYNGRGAAGATDQLTSDYGVGPKEAGIVVRAARSTYCTQAPG